MIFDMSGSHRDSTLCGGIRSKYDYNTPFHSI